MLSPFQVQILSMMGETEKARRSPILLREVMEGLPVKFQLTVSKVQREPKRDLPIQWPDPRPQLQSTM